MNKIKFLNIEIDNLTMNELLENLNKYGGFVVTPNVDHLVKLQVDLEFFKAYNIAEYCVCDSKIIQLISKFLGHPIKEKISGSDLFPAFYQYNKDNEKIKIFLLGAQQGIAQLAQININKKVGREIVIDTYSPSMGFEKNEAECQTIIEKINHSSATVLAVGAGAPKQEKWIYKYKNKLKKIKVFLAIGATIDFEAGYKPRAPKWMSELGLEWLYRLLSEPQRLWKRYLVESLPVFKFVIQQRLNLYKFSPTLRMLALPLGKRLAQKGLISNKQLQELIEIQKQEEERQLGDIIVEKGLLPQEVVEFLAKELDYLIENNYLTPDEVEDLLEPKTQEYELSPTLKMLALPLGKRLTEKGLISNEQLQKLIEVHKVESDRHLKALIVEKGLVPKEVVEFLTEELDYLIENNYLMADEVQKLLEPKKEQNNEQ